MNLKELATNDKAQMKALVSSDIASSSEARHCAEVQAEQLLWQEVMYAARVP